MILSQATEMITVSPVSNNVQRRGVILKPHQHNKTPPKPMK